MFISALFPCCIFSPKLFEKDSIVHDFPIILLKQISLTRGLVPLIRRRISRRPLPSFTQTKNQINL